MFWHKLALYFIQLEQYTKGLSLLFKITPCQAMPMEGKEMSCVRKLNP